MQGAAGPSCQDLTRALEAALGTTTHDAPTPEYYRQAAASASACSSGFGLTAPSGSSTTTRCGICWRSESPASAAPPTWSPRGTDSGRPTSARWRGRCSGHSRRGRPRSTPSGPGSSITSRPGIPEQETSRAIRVPRSTTATPTDPAEARTAVTVHAHLTALPGLLAEADLAEAHVEARDRRTGALVAYSFVTIHRALALHVAEAVRVGLARLDLEAGRDDPGTLRRIARGPLARRRRPTPIIARASTSDGRRHMGPPKRSGSRRRPRSRHPAARQGPGRSWPSWSAAGWSRASTRIGAARSRSTSSTTTTSGPMTTSPRHVGRTGELPQVTVEAGLARAVAEYRALATRQARVGSGGGPPRQNHADADRGAGDAVPGRALPRPRACAVGGRARAAARTAGSRSTSAARSTTVPAQAGSSPR